MTKIDFCRDISVELYDNDNLCLLGLSWPAIVSPETSAERQLFLPLGKTSRQS